STELRPRNCGCTLAVKNDGTNNPKVAATIDGNHRGLCVGSAHDSRRNERTSLSQARTLPKCRCLLWLGHGQSWREATHLHHSTEAYFGQSPGYLLRRLVELRQHGISRRRN